MNRLIACALLGFGLTSGVVACGDDDGAPGDTGGTTSGGSAAAGEGGGGSSAGGSSAGTSAAGTGGSGNSAGEGGAPSGGTASGGTAGSSVGGEATGGDAMGGEAAVAGAGGDGAGGAPPEVEPQLPTPFWLANFCDAISMEELGCSKSPLWYTCYEPYSHFLSAGEPDGECIEDDEEFTKLLATVNAFDALAAACPDPTIEQFSCGLDGAPSANSPTCQDAFTAADAAYQACRPQGM